jgi:hypothetical protein
VENGQKSGQVFFNILFVEGFGIDEEIVLLKKFVFCLKACFVINLNKVRC